jgi:capsular exopolysaccharide synthesis family protein
MVDEEERRLICGVSTFSPLMESFRWLRTNLRFVADMPEYSLQSLVITSSIPAEGKSTTAANLAMALARDGRRVALVDADLRRPVQHTLFQVEASPGLVDVLVGTHTIDDVLRPTMVANLSIIPGGAISLNPGELLGAEALSRFLPELGKLFDIVLIDSSPSLLVADTMILASRADGVLFVVEHGATKKSHALQAIKYLSRARPKIVGTVFNKIRTDTMGGIQFYFGKYYVPSVAPPSNTLMGSTYDERLLCQGRPRDPLPG